LHTTLTSGNENSTDDKDPTLLHIGVVRYLNGKKTNLIEYKKCSMILGGMKVYKNPYF
jgi:hypothetical protein